MKLQWLALSQRYQAALQKHLQQGPQSRVEPAYELGEQAVKLGLKKLDLARIHKTALTALVLPVCSSATKGRRVKRAGIFFTVTITPIESIHRAGVESGARLPRQNKSLTRRSAQLTAANRDLRQGILQRKTAEATLRKRGEHCAKLLRESQQLQKHLRHLTHQLLSAQEAERTKMSHELHDEVAQILLGINVRLWTLKKAAQGNTANLRKEIASTQRVVKESVQSITRFAHELDLPQPA